MGRLLAAFALLALVALGADAAVASFAEDRAAARAAAELGAPTRVELHGWPLTLHLLRGEIPRVELTAEGVPLPGSAARLARLEATLHDVRVGLASRSTVAALGLPPFAAGAFAAELDTAALAALLDVPAGVALTELVLGDGTVRLRLDGLPPAAANVVVEGGSLLLQPAPPLDRFGPIVVGTPPLVAGAHVQSVQVLPGRLRVTGVLAGG